MLAVIHLQFGQLTVSIYFFGKLAIELLMQVCALLFAGIVVQCFTYVGYKGLFLLLDLISCTVDDLGQIFDKLLIVAQVLF